ncbi:MAG: hypothetical protein NVS9B12_15630 [Vulcanimicrobiaceae bacterium]
MLENGTYAVWFKTPLGEGTGIVLLRDGTVSGRDTVMEYAGSYRQRGDAFSAKIFMKRHTPGQLSVFGIDDVDIELTGKSTGKIASCQGKSRQEPGMKFEATMIRAAD